ncbi:hypothetical protein AVENP_2471 [Arcobacter venerupis]|uniref:Uncharacterized protein n=1 Tax=Arcobacter venerupis TaxID=1054033 RepID=A0AAE7BCY6_9BACT|nr:hypothetical protein [Arcobacter venerupis]QKF67985.1 hypothetical protein AVENP_2471 [Arcobacter venerupis]RWS48302.1 hypothetical protein CKA56_14720 [Arcobacter venerupis]
MSDRLHEIMGQIGILHNDLLENEKIKDANEVFEFIKDYDIDIQKHYLNLLLQYYFQKNDLKNLKELLLVGAKFDIRFDDVKEAFLSIKSEDENVIEFMQDSVVFIKEKIEESDLKTIYDYYINNTQLQELLEYTVEIIKKNRYVCVYCFNNPNTVYGKFFLNEDLLDSLKRDLPYLLK